MTSQVSRFFPRHNIKYLSTGFRPHQLLVSGLLQPTQASSSSTHLSAHVISPLRHRAQQRAFRTTPFQTFATTHKMASATTTVPEGTNNWSTPGPAAFDFRSMSMCSLITHTPPILVHPYFTIYSSSCTCLCIPCQSINHHSSPPQS